MGVFFNIEELPVFNNAVITVGTFDGVHSGHKVILNKVVRLAKEQGGESILITFDPHPRKLISPDEPLGIITPLSEKIKLLLETGLDHVVVVPFSRAFSSLSADSYIKDFLVGKFSPKTIIIGYDHRFGHDRMGDINMLATYASAYNFNLIEIPAQLISAAAVSSTRIRNAIAAGNVSGANSMLGRPYTLKGLVIHGKKLGRTIGYPTANVQPNDKEQSIPGIGIYAVKVNVLGATYGAMLSIGVNPTVTDNKDIKIEANLFDFDSDIYGVELELVFIAKMREEQKFSSLEALKTQLHTDKINALNILSSLA